MIVYMKITSNEGKTNYYGVAKIDLFEINEEKSEIYFFYKNCRGNTLVCGYKLPKDDLTKLLIDINALRVNDDYVINCINLEPVYDMVYNKDGNKIYDYKYDEENKE